MTQAASLLLDGKLKPPYCLRVPQNSVYYRLVEERYQASLGYWCSFVSEVIYKYLECGDPHFGFIRFKCVECNYEYPLAFSCKCRHFCPSCHQKRVVEFGQWFFLYIIATDGCFDDQGGFMVGPQPDPKTFLALDWLAQLVTHIPNKGEQLVRYYSYYSNKLRGMRKKAALDEQVLFLIDTDIDSKEFKQELKAV